MVSFKYRLMTCITMMAVATAITTLIVVSIAYTEETLQPVDSLFVVDSTGKNVGKVLGWDGARPEVGFKLDNLLVLLHVTQSRFFGTVLNVSGDSLFFESSDCSGTPYLFVRDLDPPSQVFSLVPVAAVSVPGNTLYVPDENIPVGRNISSTLNPSGPLGGCRRLNGNFTVVRARPTIDLDDMFTPPFKLQAGPIKSGHGKPKHKD